MKTDDFIDLLAKDALVKLHLDRALAIALAIGAPLSAVVLVTTIGIRPDLGDALHTPRFIFKIAVTLLLAVTTSSLVFNAGKPGVPLRPYLIALLIPLGLLTLGIVTELFVLPSSSWRESMAGRYGYHCLFFIPFFSLAPLVALFWALKGGRRRSRVFRALRRDWRLVGWVPPSMLCIALTTALSSWHYGM